jgi:hypothetical protein
MAGAVLGVSVRSNRIAFSARLRSNACTAESWRSLLPAEVPRDAGVRWLCSESSHCAIETDNEQSYPVLGVSRVKLKSRMAAIGANLDDLQAGIEAGSRAAETLQTDTTKFNGPLNSEPLLRDVVRHVKDLQACARDQREAMQELREGIARLQQELKRSDRAVRPPPITRADRPE